MFGVMIYQTRGRGSHSISKHQELGRKKKNTKKGEAQPTFVNLLQGFGNRIRHSFECVVKLLNLLIVLGD